MEGVEVEGEEGATKKFDPVVEPETGVLPVMWRLLGQVHMLLVRGMPCGFFIGTNTVLLPETGGFIKHGNGVQKLKSPQAMIGFSDEKQVLNSIGKVYCHKRG